MVFLYSIVCCFVSWPLGRPGWGSADGAEGIFGLYRARVGFVPASGPTLKKTLCRTCPVVGRRTNKHEKTWTRLRKGNFKRETESLLIAAQNNAIRTNHIKVRIDKTQQSSICRLCGDRDETINHIISECSKLAQKEYKAKHAWVGKVIHWEMCKKFKFDHTNKWYMHNPASVLENDTHKLRWDFDIQTDHLISAKRPDPIIMNKKRENLQNCRLCCPS